MSASTPHCLGDFFSKHPFSDEERARLAALAANGATPAHIIKRYVTRTDGFKNGFLKAERIAGSRPGSPLYKEQAVQRIVSNLGEPSNGKYKLYWGLYKDAAIAFIKGELPALDRLLAEVRPPDGTLAVADMLKAICASASEYGVSSENIATFYEIWGVPRIENFDSLLPLWLKADDPNATKRQLSRLTAETTELKKLIEELALKVRTQEEASADNRSDSAEVRDQCGSFEERLEALATQVEKLRAKALGDEEAAGRIDERVAGLAEKVNKLAEKAKVPREEVSTRDLHKLANETKLGIATTVSEVADAVTKKMREELHSMAGELETKISVLSSELGKRRDGTAVSGGSPHAGSYRSPLIGVPTHTPVAYKLTAELDFVNSWLHHLSQSHDIALTFEQAVAYHRAFIGSPVVVCDRMFALTWIHCLAWEPFTLHMATSPTWSAEEDWAQGAEHIFRRDAGRPPHLLVLHNYDVGLPDCYLAPSLALWALRREPGALSKLFLLPARPDHVPGATVLEHAACFGISDYLTTRPLELKDGHRPPVPLHREPPRGAEPKVVAQWLRQSDHIAYDLGSIQRALKCRMPLDLVASFHRTANAIARYIDDTSAIAIAMHHQVIPWVQVTYGEARATELSNLLSTIAGSAE